MRLTLEYLRERHEFWRLRIGERGIWDSERFLPVTLVIKGDSRRYNAIFQRRIRRKGLFKKEITDKIVVYNKTEDFDEKFLDSVLVHEMIHQYIFQTNQKDNRAHGTLFRSFRERINQTFPDELKINITDRNPSIPLKGAGDKRHTLLILQYENGNYFLAVLNPVKVDFFETMVKRNMKRWGVKTYWHAESCDVYFSRFSRCTRSLHGLKKTPEEMTPFCREYNISIKG